MEINTIVESLNQHIEGRRLEEGILGTGHLVLQYAIFPNEVFKAYKIYSAKLWFIQKGTKTEILSLKITDKVLEENLEKFKDRASLELAKKLFDWIGTESYKSVINGTFKKNNEENI